jgi:hypothetical protein
MVYKVTSALALATTALAAYGCSQDSGDAGGELVDEALVGVADPSNTDRTLDCELAPLPAASKKATFRGKPIEYFSSGEIAYESDAWYRTDAPWMSAAGLDSSVLGNPGFPSPDRGFAPSAPVNLRISVVDIRNIEGKLSYHYFSNETGTSRIENWSSTKAFAMLQAGQTLRTDSGGTHGLLSTLFGGGSSAQASGKDARGEWIGTHITEVARSSDNGTAAWFKSITGPAGGTNFVRNWLDSKAQFGGLHGESPRALGNRFKADNQGPEFTSARAGAFASNSDNTLMPIDMAEFWKRLAVNTKDPTTWLKKANYSTYVSDAAARKAAFFNPQSPFALTADDLKVLDYGYVNSKTPGGLLLGAVQHPEFVDAFSGKSKLDALTGGKWRFFGKTGSGGSQRSAGFRTEAAFGGFMCIPADPTRAKLKEGRMVAFFINAQTVGSAGPARLRALKGVADLMIPQLNGAPDLWGTR